jgi:hypothetical protein
MKRNQHLAKYLSMITILLVAGLLLAACDTTATPVSAAQAEMNFLADEDGSTDEAVAPTTIEQPLEESVVPEQQVAPAAAQEAAETASETEANSAPTPNQGYGQGQGQQGNGPGQDQAWSSQGAHVIPEGDLSELEIAALQYMREEEKLARDIYEVLYDEWGVPVFANIAASEQAHMDAVAYLLDAYGLTDPAANTAPGEFSDESLQALYNQLIDQGLQSLTDALRVGAAIEEIDILDLQERLAQTENQAVIQTFNNLLQGSVNHLSAFSSNLQRQTGQAYEPQYMDAAAYEGLLASAASQGYGAGMGNGNGGQGTGTGSATGNGGAGRGQGQGQGGGRGRQ